MVLQHFDREADPGEVSRFISVHGYAIIDDLADAELMDRLATEVEPFVEASDAGRDEYDGQFTRRTGSLIERCPASRELVMHPTVVDTVRHFLGHATAQQLHLTQLISVEPAVTIARRIFRRSGDPLRVCHL